MKVPIFLINYLGILPCGCQTGSLEKCEHPANSAHSVAAYGSVGEIVRGKRGMRGKALPVKSAGWL
jgi:hypothetical protein